LVRRRAEHPQAVPLRVEQVGGGLLITVAIGAVGWQAAREVGRRLMDSVDPALTEMAEATLRAALGVLDGADHHALLADHVLSSAD
jgi:divalent metal cation (Fe/Co/Zn/Cd) transporter